MGFFQIIRKDVKINMGTNDNQGKVLRNSRLLFDLQTNSLHFSFARSYGIGQSKSSPRLIDSNKGKLGCLNASLP